MTDGSARLTKLTSLPEFHVNCLPGPVSNNCTWRGHVNSDRGDCLHRLRGHGLDSLLEFGFRKLMFGQRQRYRKFHSKSVTRARVCALDTLQAHRDDEQCDGDSESLSHAPTSCGPLQWRHAPRLPWYPIRNGTFCVTPSTWRQVHGPFFVLRQVHSHFLCYAKYAKKMARL